MENGEEEGKNTKFVRVMKFFFLLAIVTDTVFMKPSVEKVFFKLVVLGTTKQWSHQTDLLVFCVKLRHLSVLQVP